MGLFCCRALIYWPYLHVVCWLLYILYMLNTTTPPFLSTGRHKHQFGNRLLRGMIDEFYIFPCELPRLEILVLMRHCRVYFSTFSKLGFCCLYFKPYKFYKPIKYISFFLANKPKKVTEESSTTRGSTTIMTQPVNGQRNNGPVPVYKLQPQSINSLSSAYQRKPPQTDYVANNLQQILASLNVGEPRRPGMNPSMLYRPPQGYLAPSHTDKAQTLYKPAPYTNIKPVAGSLQPVPHVWSANMWNNHPPGVITPFAAQASIRHDTPASVQQVNTNHQPKEPRPFSAQGSANTQQRNTNRRPGVVMQMNTFGNQRSPFTQNSAGHFPGFNALKTQNGPIPQYANQGSKTIQPNMPSGRVNSAAQFHTPIIWHIPLGNTRKGPPGRLQKPLYLASSTGQRLLGQLKPINLGQGTRTQDRTVVGIQNPYDVRVQQPSVSQKPLLQKQKVNFMPPLRLQSNMNPQPGGPKAQVMFPPRQQQSLAYKMALLEEPNHPPQNNVPGSLTWQKQVPLRQMVTPVQKQWPPGQSYYASYNPKAPYSPKLQQRLLTPNTRLQPPSKGPLASATQKRPQGIAQTQISPFSPHFIYGQNSWPWVAWRNRASPIAQASARSSSSPLPQAYGNNLPSYHPSAGLLPNLQVSPYTTSPQVLLYYYFYPKTIKKALRKIANIKGERPNGNFLQTLTKQISSAAFNSNPGETTTSTNPTVTGQTGRKITTTQSINVPQGTSKQFTQTPKTPYYGLATGPGKTPMGPLAKTIYGKQQVQAPLFLPQLGKSTGQLTSLPLVTSQNTMTSPYVAYPNAKGITQTQRTLYPQFPAIGSRKSQLSNGLLNRPIYIETVPYQLYYQLQKLPSLNTQSSTQQYLQRVLNDVLRLRYGKRKKKKKKKKRGVKEKSRLDKSKESRIGLKRA